jgi:hypothetical protein
LRPISRVPWLLGLCALFVAAGCGIGVDSEPRALPLSTTTSTTAAPESSGDAPSIIYVVQTERLVPLTRSLETRTPEAVMGSLLVPPTSAEGTRLSSSIPAATELLGLRLDSGTLFVDLSSDFEDVVGPARQQAIGQVVLSETLLPDVDRLSFSIDGDLLQVTSPDRGDVDVVDECDYASLLADPDAEETELSEGQTALLRLRREDLDQRCI